ncbi:MAG: hypothetical protein LR017_02645 [Candidatus Pacebacteria bacterium]|nr:hypothetical protein [Candidatus Paceibacterota bacterium]
MASITKNLIKTATLTAVTLLLFVGVAALAQEDDLTPQEHKEQHQALLEERKAEMEAKREEVQANMEVKKAEMEAKKEERAERKAAFFAEKVQNRLTNLSHNIITRMGAAIERLRNITDRMLSRIDTLEAQGIDTGASKDTLGDVHTGLDTAEAMLSSLASDVEDAVSSDDPRAAFQSVKATMDDVRDIITQSHALLRQGVEKLKTAVRDARPEPGTELPPAPDTPDTDTTEAETDESDA